MPRGKTPRANDKVKIVVEESNDGVVRKTIITVTAPAGDFGLTDQLTKMGKILPYSVKMTEAVQATHESYIQGAIDAVFALPNMNQGENTEAAATGSKRPSDTEKGTSPKSEKKPEAAASRPGSGPDTSTSPGRVNGPVSG
jgi:hypothetical protein